MTHHPDSRTRLGLNSSTQIKTAPHPTTVGGEVEGDNLQIEVVHSVFSGFFGLFPVLFHPQTLPEALVGGVGKLR